MPLVPLDPSLPRSCLLVCDGCDGVLMHGGGTTAKGYALSDPDELAPHYDEIGAAAHGHRHGLARERWLVDLRSMLGPAADDVIERACAT